MGASIWDPDGSIPAGIALALERLASYTIATDGSGMMGYGPGLSYAPNTIGYFLNGFIDTSSIARGDALIGVKQTFTGAVAKTQHDYNEWEVDLFAAMSEAEISAYVNYTGAVDHTAAFNIAISAVAAIGGRCKLKCGAGLLRLTSNINITGPTWVDGAGHAGQATTGTDAVNNGTLIKFDHTGFGFTVTGSGFKVSNLTVFRPQEAPGGGWVPYASNYDFNLSSTDTTLENILVWGSAKFCILNAGGRLRIDKLSGQVFNNGITIVVATDSVNITNVHLWPFWSQDSNVQSYTKANLVASEYRRCDGLQVSDFFSIWHNKCIRFVHDAAGDTTNASFANIYSDDGGHGVITESGTNGVTAKFSNFVHQGTVANSCAVQANGTNAILDFSNFTSTASLISAVRNDDGTGNKIRITNPYITQWNGANGGFLGMSCSGTNNELGIVGRSALGTAAFGSTAAFLGVRGLWHNSSFSGTTAADGRLNVPHGLGYIPTTAEASIIGALPYTVNIEGTDATNIKTFVTNAGVALASTAISLSWRAYY